MSCMQGTGPVGLGFHVLFTVAIGRYAQKLGLYYAQFIEQFGEAGALQDVKYDQQHPTVKACAKVPEEVLSKQTNEYELRVIMRVR